MSFRRTYRQARPRHKAVPVWRLALVIVLMFWLLAAVVYTLSEWIAPAVFSSLPSSTPSAFNYGKAFSTPFIKTFGLWMSVVLFALGPVVVGWKAFERGFDSLIRAALGLGDRRRRSGKRSGAVTEMLSGAPPACPICGSSVVLREARRGPNAGSHFWGCSTYPTCRGTLPA